MPTCVKRVRKDGATAEVQFAKTWDAVGPCGQPATSMTEADGHRSYYCAEHTAYIIEKFEQTGFGIYPMPIPKEARQ